MKIPKATAYIERHREIISDPLNVFIERVPNAGLRIDPSHVVLHNGHIVQHIGPFSYYGAFSDILVTNRGVHEPLEEFCFQEALARMHVATPVMVELGAYWGHYSMWMMKKKPLSRVVLIDESAENLGSAQYNFGLNGYRGKLSVGRIGFCDDTLGNICTTHNLPIIDILHVDIQGAEVDLLQDSIKILSSGSVRIIFLSTHSNYIHGLCYRLLQFCGFRIEVSSDFDHHSTSYDGFILAAYHDLDPIFPGFLPWGRADICEANPDQIVDYIRQVGTLRAGWSSGLR